jgi:hypothetical protein
MEVHMIAMELDATENARISLSDVEFPRDNIFIKINIANNVKIPRTKPPARKARA